MNLLNVLSAFPAVYEALSCVPQHNSTSTVLGLLKKMVLWEGEERGMGLVNPEDAHLCGLRCACVCEREREFECGGDGCSLRVHND